MGGQAGRRRDTGRGGGRRAPHITRCLAIVGVAATLGGAHSLIAEPVRVSSRPAVPVERPNGPVGEPVEPAGVTPVERATELAPASGKLSLEASAALHERMLAGEPIWFLDARRRDQFDAGRVLGAVWMPSARVSGGDGLDELFALGVQPEDTLVIYCTGGDCDASENTKLLLQDAYFDIRIMLAGYDDWSAAGLAVEGVGEPAP